jgi:hypothetical protein
MGDGLGAASAQVRVMGGNGLEMVVGQRSPWSWVAPAGASRV